MTDKEVRRLSRARLLEMMLEQGREIERLNEALSRLDAELAACELRLPVRGDLQSSGARVLSCFRDAERRAVRREAQLERVLAGQSAAPH